MDGKLFLGTARFLKNNGTDESYFRSAVSRAYYACYLETRQVAFDNCNTQIRLKARIRSAKDILHKPLQQYLNSSPDITVRNLGQDLKGLHGSRVDADYQMNRPISSNDAQDAIDEATDFLLDLNSLQPRSIGLAMETHINQVF